MNLKQIRASATHQATYKHAQSLGLTKDVWAKMLQEGGLNNPTATLVIKALTWPDNNFAFFSGVRRLQAGDSILDVHALFKKDLDTYKLNGVSYPVSQKLSQAAWAKEYRNVNKI
jgi:hypothetical protein